MQLIAARLAALDGREGRFASGETVVLTVLLFGEVDCAAASVSIGLADNLGQVVFATTTKHLGLDMKLASGVSTEVSLRFPVHLSPGKFTIDLQCWGIPPGRSDCFLSRRGVCGFEVHNPWLPEFTGIIYLPVQANAAEWRQNGASFWMPPLSAAHADTTIEPQCSGNHDDPLQAKPGALVEFPVRITNLCDRWIASNPPFPVMLSYHVSDADDIATVTYDGRRTRLDRPIPPAGSITQTMLLDAPVLPGRYVLHLSLVQEGRFWFDGLPGHLSKKVAMLVSA